VIADDDPTAWADDEDPPPMFNPLWSREVTPAAADVPWLWHGYLAPYHITLLTSQWRVGKTTLLSVLLARRAAGSLVGRPLRRGRTAVVCEEGDEYWRQRRRALDFGDDVAFFCRPLEGGSPTRREWRGLIDSVARLGASDGVDLAVIDPLSAFLPRHSENHNELMRDALRALDRLQRQGMAVLLLHHPRKGLTLDGQAARGAGSLLSHADISVEMRPYSADDDDRRRVLWARSRFAATPRQLVIEWAADGTDYLARGSVADEEFRASWERLAAFFASAPDKLTRREVRALWPSGRDAPSEQTLWRWLERAVAENRLRRDGTGHRNAPYRYWLPAREAEWLQDPVRRLVWEAEQARAELDTVLVPPQRPARRRKS
jgi:hypothetical protein